MVDDLIPYDPTNPDYTKEAKRTLTARVVPGRKEPVAIRLDGYCLGVDTR